MHTMKGLFQARHALGKLGHGPCTAASIQVVRRYNVIPLGGVGARVTGLDITKPISPEEANNLKQDVIKHELLVFKKQQGLTVGRTLQLAELFGPLELEPQQGKAVHPKQPHPAVSRLSNNADEGLKSIGNSKLHVDGQYLEKPNDFALYHTVKASKGSQTWFVSMGNVLRHVSSRKIAFWDTLWQQRILHMHGEKTSDIAHPLVITHPRTNKKVLCTHLGFIDRFIQYFGSQQESVIPSDETAKIVDDIDREMRGNGDENIYKHTWSDDDVIISDNWSVLHVAGPQTQISPEEVGLRIFHRILTKGSNIPQK